MKDDLLDWGRDSAAGRSTWLLCEARRRKAADESVAGWMGRRGIDWAAQQLYAWMNELLEDAQLLSSLELVEYLEFRSTNLAEQMNLLNKSIRAWTTCLGSMMEKQGISGSS
jgi:hypothetical protein